MAEKLSEELIAAVTVAIKDRAKHSSDTAAQSGMTHDGGASSLLAQLSAWHYGLGQKVPDEWKSYQIAFERAQDPEWEQYKRLKAKFE
jgi:hypothetical protein